MNIDLHDNDFDAFMKDKFEGHTSNPPPEYWDQIENQLNLRNVVHGKRTIFYWLGAAAASIVLITSLYYTFNENPANTLRYSNRIHSTEQQKQNWDQLINENPVKNIRKNTLINQNSIPDTINNSVSSQSKKEVSFPKSVPSAAKTIPAYTNSIINEAAIAFQNPQPLPASNSKSLLNDTTQNVQIISPFTITSNTPETALNENTPLKNTVDSIKNVTPLSDSLIAAVTGNSQPAPASKHRIAYEVFFTPGYSYRAVTDNQTYYNSEYNKAYFDKRDKGYFTFSTGFLANYKINSKISLSSGFSYDQYSQEFSTESFHVNYDGTQDAWIYTSSGDLHFKITASDSISQNDILRSSIRFSHINVPLLLEYRFAKYYLIDVGISYSYLISQKLNLRAENYEGNCETTPISGIKKSSLCLNLGIGREIPLKNNFSLIIQSSVNIFLTTINDKASVKSYPFSIGLQTGLKYSL